MILLTGATGYIGSHTWIELLKESFQVIGIDNLSNSSIKCLDAIAEISGEAPNFIEGDIRDAGLLQYVFDKYPVSHVIHLAALKDVGQSINNHDEYFDVNVRGLKNLLQVMRVNGCSKIIFSSSAAVYGENAISPISESVNPSPSNYYGQTKLDGENLLAEGLGGAMPLNSVSLRYFNIAGWHPTGLLKNYALSTAHSLFSEIESVLTGEIDVLRIFGDDWETSDGTCIRDYLHVADLARGHIQALSILNDAEGCVRLNLGLGMGRSVYEVISTYERVIGRPIPKMVVARRAGDISVSFADISLAIDLIGWDPTRTLSDMCEDGLALTKSSVGSYI